MGTNLTPQGAVDMYMSEASMLNLSIIKAQYLTLCRGLQLQHGRLLQ